MSITIQNLNKTFGNFQALHNINLNVPTGKLTSLLGPSGCGKTTLLRIIAGLENANNGTILFDGQDVTDKHVRERKVGFVFQHYALFRHMNVFDNIAFPMRELTDLPEAVIRDLVVLKLNAVGLRGVESLMPSELSGGMARRVALARTIALDPELMLYDEPFTGLDPISLGVIAHLISRANTALRSTSVMVTHDIEQSLAIVNQVIFLAHGEVMFSGSPEEMRTLDSPWVQQFVGGLPNGPVAFRYPAQTTLQQDLLG